MTDNSAETNAVKLAYDPAASVDELYAALRLTRSAGLRDASAHILDRLKHEFKQSGDLRFMLENAIFSCNFDSAQCAAEKLQVIQKRFPRNGHAFILHSDLLVKDGEFEAARRVLESGWELINEKHLRLNIIYRIIKLKSRLHAAATSTPLVRPGVCTPEPRAALVMMARDENDIIRFNLEHHYNIGFRKFVIIDNNSNDGTSQTIEDFSRSKSDSIFVKISDPFVGYFQGEKTGAAVDFAKSYFSGIRHSIDWVFIIDADEFMSGAAPTTCLSDLIMDAEGRGANFIAFSLCNAAPHTKIDSDFLNQDIYEDFHVVAAYPPRLVLKNAVHAALQCRITTGNHILDGDDLDPEKCLIGAEAGWKLVHLPYRSTAQVARKILNGSAAIQSRGDSADIGRHWMALGADMRRDAEATALSKIQSYRNETLSHSRDNLRSFRL